MMSYPYRSIPEKFSAGFIHHSNKKKSLFLLSDPALSFLVFQRLVVLEF